MQGISYAEIAAAMKITATLAANVFPVAGRYCDSCHLLESFSRFVVSAWNPPLVFG
jgi:hypothetical protein